MLKYLLSLVLVLSSPLSQAAEARMLASKYQPEVDYEVFRDGKPVGEYKLRFSYPTGSSLEVDVDMNLSMRVMGFFTYDYQYEATERWQEGALSAVEIMIDKNGDREQISAVREGGRLLVKEGEEAPKTFDASLMPTNHWHAGILRQREVFNTLTGEVSQIQVNEERLADWRIGDQQVRVIGYRLGGDLKDTLSWYDDEGVWRGMQFSARDGSTIEVRWRGAEVINDLAG